MLTRHGGKEYAYVISGRLGIRIGFEEYLLGPGESISFDAQAPHRLWAVGRKPAVARSGRAQPARRCAQPRRRCVATEGNLGTRTMKIGFIGLGRMGSAIAGRVLGGGHELQVYNRTPGRRPISPQPVRRRSRRSRWPAPDARWSSPCSPTTRRSKRWRSAQAAVRIAARRGDPHGHGHARRGHRAHADGGARRAGPDAGGRAGAGPPRRGSGRTARHRRRRAGRRAATLRAAVRGHRQAHLRGRGESRRSHVHQARQQLRARLRAGGDERSVLAGAPLRRRPGRALRRDDRRAVRRAGLQRCICRSWSTKPGTRSDSPPGSP